MVELENYQHREHAKAKHALLEQYVTRYIMILGQAVDELVFVDAFAGPWMSRDAYHRDTSFGLSNAAMRACSESLKQRFGKALRLRALWIEADPTAYAKLREYAQSQSSDSFRIETRNARFDESVGEVADFIGRRANAFVFIDPKGYRGLIEAQTLEPLLRLPRVELLINYMWSHIKYAFGRSNEAGHRANLTRLYGPRFEQLAGLRGEELEREALRAYEDTLRSAGMLRVKSYPILETRGQRLPKYFLVHATHAAAGLVTFAEECEKMERTQAEIFRVANTEREAERVGSNDLFGEVSCDPVIPTVSTTETNAWRNLLPGVGDSINVDLGVWAGLIERARCMPDALQRGLKELVDVGVLGIDCAGFVRRRSKFVHPDKAERVTRLA